LKTFGNRVGWVVITIYPHNSLAGFVLIGIAFSTAAVAFLVTRRWKFKALPLVALSGLIMPFAAATIIGAILYVIDVRAGRAGIFFFHVGSLTALLGLPSALIGFGAALITRQARSKVG
jgi:hypothetical protein